MPAQAGRVKMPHNNRVSSSSALKMNDIWSKTIGYDPYAADNEKPKDEVASSEHAAGLMLLAKMSNLSGGESRGACSKCGMVGHLSYMCRNNMKLSDALADDEVISYIFQIIVLIISSNHVLVLIGLFDCFYSR